MHSKLRKINNPVLNKQTTRSALINVIELRADLLDSGDEFTTPRLLHDEERRRFCDGEFGMEVNDILMATRKYEMISNNGCQRYRKL
jgi:hypothetical protein